MCLASRLARAFWGSAVGQVFAAPADGAELLGSSQPCESRHELKVKQKSVAVKIQSINLKSRRHKM